MERILSPPRKLIQGGQIVSMDPDLGDLPRGDILIVGSRIEAIAPFITADDSEIIDAAGMIVMPGMIDCHKHAWQWIFRGVMADSTLTRFFGEIVPAVCPALTPADVYAANLLGAADALDAGVTTFTDWCHITMTPEHTRAAVRALQDSGARAWFGHAASLLTWSDRSLPHPSDIRSLQREHFSKPGHLVRLALAARGPMFADLRPAAAEFVLARELGIPVTVHVDMPGHPGGDVAELARAGVLGPDVTLLHGNNLTAAEIAIAEGAGCSFVDSSPLDLLLGIGPAVTERLMARSIKAGISSDTATANPTDLFWVMRAIVLLERARAYQSAFEANRQPADPHLTCRRVLELATLGGAKAAWLEDLTGSLTPGKEADIILIRATDLNMVPVHDAAAALVFHATPANVDTVLVAGRIVKRAGRLLSVDPDHVARLATQAGERLRRYGLAVPHPGITATSAQSPQKRRP